MPAYPKDTPEDRQKFLKMYQENDCLLIRTCRDFGTTKVTVNEWRRQYPEFDEKMRESQMLLNEGIEGSLVRKAKEGEVVPMIFYLKNNWREKYADKQYMEVEPSKLWFDATQKPQLEAGGDGAG